jgi:hypothetical protein
MNSIQEYLDFINKTINQCLGEEIFNFNLLFAPTKLREDMDEFCAARIQFNNVSVLRHKSGMDVVYFFDDEENMKTYILNFLKENFSRAQDFSFWNMETGSYQDLEELIEEFK